MRTIDEKLHVSWSARPLGTRSPISISRGELDRRAAAHLLTRDNARRIAANRQAPGAAARPVTPETTARPSLARRRAFGGEGLSAKLTGGAAGKTRWTSGPASWRGTHQSSTSAGPRMMVDTQIISQVYKLSNRDRQGVRVAVQYLRPIGYKAWIEDANGNVMEKTVLKNAIK
jgi:hypothetical protein